MDREKITRKALLAVGEAARARTADRLAARASKRAAHTCADGPTFTGQVPARVVNAADVERWWRAAMAEEFSAVRVPRFLVREQVLCKRLLIEFGETVVERAVADLIAGWRARRTVLEGLHPPEPTVLHLWRLRQEVCGGGAVRLPYVPRPTAAADRDRMRRKGEWSEPEGVAADGIGWGDDDDH